MAEQYCFICGDRPGTVNLVGTVFVCDRHAEPEAPA